MINEFSKYIKDFVNSCVIDGYLDKWESLALYLAARFDSKEGRVVEIGSYFGRSTFWLSKALKERDGTKVVAIDPHTGNEELIKAKKIPKEGTFKYFKKNLLERGVWDNVEPMVMTSEEASKLFHEPVRLLFIDGSHEYELVKKDVELWVPKVIMNGLIFMHDSTNPNTFPDVYKVRKELEKTNVIDRYIEVQNTTIFLKR